MDKLDWVVRVVESANYLDHSAKEVWEWHGDTKDEALDNFIMFLGNEMPWDMRLEPEAMESLLTRNEDMRVGNLLIEIYQEGVTDDGEIVKAIPDGYKILHAYYAKD